MLMTKVRSIQLITNNPKKIEQLTRCGIALRSVRPTKTHLNPYNRAYLRAKAELTGHRLGDADLGVAG